MALVSEQPSEVSAGTYGLAIPLADTQASSSIKYSNCTKNITVMLSGRVVQQNTLP